MGGREEERGVKDRLGERGRMDRKGKGRGEEG